MKGGQRGGKNEPGTNAIFTLLPWDRSVARGKKMYMAGRGFYIVEETDVISH